MALASEKRYEHIDRFVRRGADKYAPLPHEKLLKLFRLMEKYPKGHFKHERSRDRIIHHNQRYVVKIAAKYMNKGLPLEDLIQEGNCGLMTAISKFDRLRGFRFTTYADYWIREAIRSAIKIKARLIRIPNQKLQQKVQVQREWNYQYTVQHNTATSQELAKATGLTVDQVEEMKTFDYEFTSLDAPASHNRETPLHDTIADDNTMTPEERMLAKEEYAELFDALGEIPHDDAKFIRRLFGIGGMQRRTEVQMSELYSCPTSVIRKRTKEILLRLQDIMIFRNPEEYQTCPTENVLKITPNIRRDAQVIAAR